LGGDADLSAAESRIHPTYRHRITHTVPRNETTREESTDGSSDTEEPTNTTPARALSALPAQPPSDHGFDRDYWIANSIGFRVDGLEGRLGFVEPPNLIPQPRAVSSC
jgi:hypothetical protein